ncbi:LOW QUALITY PROTEIN: reverse transcriptase [Phytophthora megakarya]|uniref:Reverse transcriptase n=1 Tax=Phytophthora megakarya TaxID=4795 RepID=A0A225V3B2_9STRA|nr:LOW QUALITY PROTEIN: reverse transcriptase [Phytophthora megakarya]
MTDRARLISAFITSFGLFEWNRMPFGKKNAPQIYQRLIDNALYGFTRIPKSEDHGGTLDVLEVGEPVDPDKPSVLGRRSYIDDILIPANNWDQLCDRVESLLEACDKWNLSISVVKSFWGMPKMEYLGHKVSPNGLRFIEGYPSYASVLYELREIDFAVVRPPKRGYNKRWKRRIRIEDHRRQILPKWIHAGSIPIDPSVRSKPRSLLLRSYGTLIQIGGPRLWYMPAIGSIQEYDQIYYPVMFASRILKSNELNDGIAEKEVLVLLRILDLNYNALVGRPIHVLTRHSTLTWLFRSTVLQGRLGQWAALLSFWTPEITKCVKGEDEILGSLAARLPLDRKWIKH